MLNVDDISTGDLLNLHARAKDDDDEAALDFLTAHLADRGVHFSSELVGDENTDNL